MTVALADSTYAFIEQKVRRLTASASSYALSSNDIQRAVNTFYNNDFPYAIKLDQTRFVYKFLTVPNVDRYPVDVNKYQGFRSPVYFSGIKGNFFKNRDQLFNLFPRYNTLFQPASGDGITTSFTFNLFSSSTNPYPQPNYGILSGNVTIGGIDINGDPIRILDDGGAVVDAFGIGSNTTSGKLIFYQSNAVGDAVYVDAFGAQQNSIPKLSPLGGQQNANLPNTPYPPTPLTSNYCGTIDYVTSDITVTFPVPPANGSTITVWANLYNPGRPYNLLFWNNELTIRPVPDKVYTIEIEAYQTPSQFLALTDHPTINQWAQYIAYGAAIELLRERQDMEGVENLMEGFKRQEALVLERQGVEEIGQPNITIFNSSVPSYGWFGWGIGPGF